MEIHRLKQLLSEVWSYNTCSPSLRVFWNENNPSLGQCAITALVVNDYFGGKIMRCMSPTGSHYYNLIDGKIIDLTAEQFNAKSPDYETGEERTREYLLGNPDTNKRYTILSSGIDQILKENNELSQRRFEMCKKQRQNIFKEEKQDEVITDEKINNAMKFYLLATQLKYKIRSGWDQNHWHVKSERIESIAEHVYGTCILAISLESEFPFDIDLEKVIKMLTIHEIGEVLIGDITPFDKTTLEEKVKLEHKAMQDVLSSLAKREELYELLVEFDEKDTNEAKFAYLCDKLEADIQAKVYQDAGCQRELSDQTGNVVFNTPLVQDMVKNGAKDAFDIWYEWDKSKFTEAPVFEKTLGFVKNNNMNVKSKQ